MTDRLSRPKSGPQWIAWVNTTLARLDARRPTLVPIGGLVLWPGGGVPQNWLAANGATFTAATWPRLAARLGGTTLPNPAAVSGMGWIIRAA